MEEYRLCILGIPETQARHRHFKKGDFIGTYDPSAKAKKQLAMVVQDEAPEVPLTGPIALELIFYMPRPKNHYGTGRNAGKLKGSAPYWHVSRPDSDNLEKFVKDALNGIFWKDDSQICYTSTQKIYSDQPRSEIVINKLN